MLCVHKVNHIRTTQKALSPASTYSSAIFKITCYMQSHSLQIHPIPYHQSPLTMLLRESLSVERRRQTKVTFFRQLLIVVYNWLFYSPLQIFKSKTCTDLAAGKRLSLRRRSSQFHGNTRVSEFHSSPKIFCIDFNFWTVPILFKNGFRFLSTDDKFEMVLMLAGSFPQWRWQTENRRTCHTMRRIRWFLFQAFQIHLLSYIARNHSKRNLLL